MNSIIENNKERIIELCIQFHVKELYVFGSAVRDDFTAESDIDFLVEFKNTSADLEKTLENEDNLKQKLEHLLEKEIDLIKYSLLKNKYLKYFINQEKKLVYAEA